MPDNKKTEAIATGADWPGAEFYRSGLELFISKVEGSLNDPEWLAVLCKSQREWLAHAQPQREATNLPKKDAQ